MQLVGEEFLSSDICLVMGQTRGKALLHLEEIKEEASGMFGCLGLSHSKKEVGTQ